MTDELDMYKNQMSIFPVDEFKDTPVLFVGAGGIGSSSVVCLAKMGMQNITVCDFDTVELHNVASQFYRMDDIGKLKVEALQEIVREQSGVEISIITEPFEASMIAPHQYEVVVTSLDNNDVRKEVVDACDTVPIIIDARMTGYWFEWCQFSFMERDKYFDKFWYPQSEVTSTVCSEKATAFNCFNIAGTIWALIRARLVDEEHADIPFTLMHDFRNFVFA